MAKTTAQRMADSRKKRTKEVNAFVDIYWRVRSFENWNNIELRDVLLAAIKRSEFEMARHIIDEMENRNPTTTV